MQYQHLIKVKNQKEEEITHIQNYWNISKSTFIIAI